MTPEETAIRQWLSKPAPLNGACGCLGPQGDDPVCPCAMKYVEKVGETFYNIVEHRSPNGITHTAEILPARAELEEFGHRHLTLRERLEVYKRTKNAGR